jgi:hypothetical protein
LAVSSAYTMEQGVAEMNDIFKAHEERMMAILKDGLEEMKSIVKHREVPREEATVRSSGALKKRHRGQNLAAKRCQKPKERTRGKSGSQKRLTVTSRKMTCHAGGSWCKSHRQEGFDQGQG